MKKAIIFAIFSLLTAATAFGAASGYLATLPTGLNGKLSTNVLLNYDSAADKSGYSASTYHTSGTRSFGSSSGDAAIYASSETATALPTAPTGTASAAFAGVGTWSAL